MNWNNALWEAQRLLAETTSGSQWDMDTEKRLNCTLAFYRNVLNADDTISPTTRENNHGLSDQRSWKIWKKNNITSVISFVLDQ